MSLWWARKDQLDAEQVELIERLPLRESHIILGPPGSGKTNVLLRRAQFVRSQGMPRVIVLTFTRPLTEFVKTGCHTAEGNELFPPALVVTIENWARKLCKEHKVDVPERTGNFLQDKKNLAAAANGLVARGRHEKYDAIFVDEAQDLIEEEITLIREWSDAVFYVGDDKQRIYDGSNGIISLRAFTPPINTRVLSFHYRMCPEICEMADRILRNENDKLAETCHYRGPTPGRINIHGPLSMDDQIDQTIESLKTQLRAYSDMLNAGDRLGVVVPRQTHRDMVHQAFEDDDTLAGKSQVVRARQEGEYAYDPTIDTSRPIYILTEKGCKGLEFRAAHWLFVDIDTQYRKSENYYTTITRAKTGLDIYHAGVLPTELAGAYSAPTGDIWSL